MKYLDYKMKNLTITLVLFILISSCSKHPTNYIEYIDGYWEIESVLLSNGVKKQYNINQTIDYITLNDSLKGFRKKMKPMFDGTYKTSKTIETFFIKIENDSLNIYYATKFSKWKETVLMANSSHLQIINQNNDVFLYKRFTPIAIE